jgi:hypothetical protein
MTTISPPSMFSELEDPPHPAIEPIAITSAARLHLMKRTSARGAPVKRLPSERYFTPPTIVTQIGK